MMRYGIPVVASRFMVNMHGCEMLITALEVDSGVRLGITGRLVWTFPDNGVVGGFSNMGVRKGIVVSADGTGDLLAISLVCLCLDTVGVGHFQSLHISRFRTDLCGRNMVEKHTRGSITVYSRGW